MEYEPGLQISVRYEGRTEAGEVIESVGVIPQESHLDHCGLMADVVCNERVNTGIALVPQLVEEMDSGKVEIELYHEKGDEGRELDIGKHYSGFVTDLFPSVQIPFSGHLVIRHTGKDVDKVLGIGLLVEYHSSGWELTSLPVNPWDIPPDCPVGQSPSRSNCKGKLNEPGRRRAFGFAQITNSSVSASYSPVF